MSADELLHARVDRLERELFRWRIAVAVISVILMLSSLALPAHAVDQFLTVLGLSADTVKATSITASEVTVRKLTVRDFDGNIRAVLGMDDIGGSGARLEIRDATGGRNALLSVANGDSRLSLRSGAASPAVTVWASTSSILPAGISVSDGKKPRLDLELSGDPAIPNFTLSDSDGKARVDMSAYDGDFFAGFYNRFGSINLSSYRSGSTTPEPMLEIRGEGASRAQLRFGIEKGEPAVGIKDGAGALVWQPKFVKSTEGEKDNESIKKEAADPL